MKKISTSRYLTIAAKSTLLLGIVISMSFSNSQKASAAVPGCYEDRSPTYVKVACPNNDQISQGVDQGNCYVRRSTNGGPLGAATFAEQACNTFNVEPEVVEEADFIGGKASLDNGAEDGCNTNEALNTSNCSIIRYLVIGINFLSAVALMSIIASAIFAGFQYITAQDNSGQIEAAKKRMIMTFIALGLFIFMYSLLDYLLPGGIF